MPHSDVSLVADVGGTNTRVALVHGASVVESSIRRFANAEYGGLEEVLTRYLADAGRADCAGACVAVAGPVRDGRASMTNLDWNIDCAALARATGAGTVAILNDLQAQGHAIGHLAPEKLREIMPFADAPHHAAKLVIGVGTGFNACVVLDTEDGRHVPPSEAGRASLSAICEADLRLASYVSNAPGSASVEDVLSGRGLERIYAWLAAEQGATTEKDAPSIMAGCADGDDRRALETVRIFTRFLGTEAGDLSLVHLPFDGVYLAGGVARSVAPYLRAFGFAEAFRNKGRFAHFMDNFGVAVIEDDYAALNGCAGHLKSIMHNLSC